MAQYFDAQTRRHRRRKRRVQNYLCFVVCVASILLVSLGITKILEWRKGGVISESQPASEITGTTILAPLPMENAGAAPATAAFGPARQEEESAAITPHNAQTIRLASRGQVSLDYFSDAAFVGDSLTEGFTEYNINLSGALIGGYVGVGPDTIVNRATVTHPQRGAEVVLDLLAANQPKKVYVLLGTNTLVSEGTEEKFLAYYGQMLDALKQTLGENTLIYVQSIPPVRPEALATRPGLESSRLQAINQSLAALADEKDCRFVDLWEALADADGNLNADYAQPDGVHLTAGNGYTAWVSYLRSHTVYAADNEWTPGTAYDLS